MANLKYSTAARTTAEERQSQLELFQIYTIYISGYGTKIPNRNTQITNNIKIPSFNEQNISITYWMSCAILSVLNFRFWTFVFV